MRVDELNLAWLNFIKAAILSDYPDHTVIFAERDGPRPNKPYLTLKINGPFRVTITDSRKFNEETETFEYQGHRRYSLSVQSYGIDHLDVLDDILIGTQNPEHNHLLKAWDIGIENRGNIIDISDRVSTAWEKRGSLDISFLSSKIKNTNIGIIETVEIGGEVANGDDEKIINTFTVPEP